MARILSVAMMPWPVLSQPCPSKAFAAQARSISHMTAGKEALAKFSPACAITYCVHETNLRYITAA